MLRMTSDDDPCHPLSVLFSMYGCTTGSKLLFKYPFIRKPDENDLEKTLHLNNIVENTGKLRFYEIT